MSIGFYATLAGERGKLANANWQAAHSWQKRSEELEDALLSERDTNRRLQHQLNQAAQHNASWQAHAQQLEAKVRNWQQSAIESEAISRAKTAVVEEVTGGKAPIDYVGEEAFAQIIEDKKGEVIEQWGINPWASE